MIGFIIGNIIGGIIGFTVCAVLAVGSDADEDWEDKP